MEMYNQKFGKERVEKMVPYMKEQGAKVGIKFSYGGKVGNTLNSHRLVQFAKEKGKVDEMVEKIMSYYFEQEKDISDLKVLKAAAAEVGLDEKETEEFLESEKHVDTINDQVREAYMLGITGVPAFVINQKELLSGAQETDTWEEVLEDLGYLKSSDS
eukprot:CAMPEP_0184487230 /NCGR_PEP_ID=MMETSP0113_2-20130426/9526_1 /TAXON_ID=91329 /ORGANISM="Norrisiella sphaerica, Strain BC52" /LENGTH=157 /DNA_ID=CAMNT_0026869445 /DNA_START=376 /DNA_END=849 /DNA_ORIENTATION=+